MELSIGLHASRQQKREGQFTYPPCWVIESGKRTTREREWLISHGWQWSKARKAWWKWEIFASDLGGA